MGHSGNHYQVPGSGPICLYRHYRRSCAPASFKVTEMGIDTFASLTFTVLRSPCRVTVDGKNTVYTGSPRSHSWHQRCARVAQHRNGSVFKDGVFIEGCSGPQGDYILSPPHLLGP